MTGAERIAAERQRQIDAEGYTPEHDAEHLYELRDAAASYLWVAGTNDPGAWTLVPPDWPHRWVFKPGDRIRCLEKAGALIAAEIDRLLAERADR